jgi:Family of unknown function (DUF6512)
MNTSAEVRQANIFRWEMWGIVFIIFCGALLHFTFDWSGGWRPMGVISAVNESVWEHLKLAFWPAVFWTIIEYFFVRRTNKDDRPDFVFARAIGAYIMPAIIVINFYSYTPFTGEPVLAVDLASFVIGVVLGQWVSYKIWSSLRLPRMLNWIGLGMFVLGIVFFAVFTFYPPQTSPFQDPPTGGYGII